jgi:cell division initiation protein
MPPTNPLDVQSVEFSRAMRGYSIDEVDAFLDQVTQELDRLRGDIERLREQRPGHADEQAIARALVTAQLAAQQTVEDAKAEAERILTEAEANATRNSEAADAQAREILEAAELHAREVKTSLEERRHELGQSIKALEAFEDEYRGRLRGSVESMLRALEDSAPKGRVAPPEPPELRLMAEQEPQHAGGSHLPSGVDALPQPYDAQTTQG